MKITLAAASVFFLHHIIPGYPENLGATSSSSLTKSLVSLGSWYGIGTWDFEGRSWLARVQISQAMGPMDGPWVSSFFPWEK